MAPAVPAAPDSQDVTSVAAEPLQPPPVQAEPDPAAVDANMEVGGAEDYFLDCSVCKKRGVNLDANSQLVACDNCDRWEHVRCHHKADERAGRPKRDFDTEDFLCEDCEEIDTSVVLPSAPKRERSEKEKQGAKKGAAKRKAKAAADRAKKAAAAAAASGSGVGPKSGPARQHASIADVPPSQPTIANGTAATSNKAIDARNGAHPSSLTNQAATYQPAQPASIHGQFVGHSLGGPTPSAQAPFHMPSPSLQSPSLAPQQGMRSPSFQPMPGPSGVQYSAALPQYQQQVLPPHLQQYSQAMYPQGRQMQLQSGTHMQGQQPGQQWPPQHHAFPPQAPQTGGMFAQYAYHNQPGMSAPQYHHQNPSSMQAPGNIGFTQAMQPSAGYPAHLTHANPNAAPGHFSPSHHPSPGVQVLQNYPNAGTRQSPQSQTSMPGLPPQSGGTPSGS